MQNDFLSNLSSRALQNSEADAPVTGLQPRLASRFENFEAPLAFPAYQVPHPEDFAEFDAEGDAGSRPTSVPERARTPVVQKAPFSAERSGPGRLTVPEPSFEKTGHPLQADRTRTLPNPRRPMLVEDQADLSPILPVEVERSAFPNSPRRNEDIQGPAISSYSESDSFRKHQDKTRETQSQAAVLASPAADLKSTVPPLALPADLPGVQQKVVPERIEVTRLERQIQVPMTGSQILPSVDPPRIKTQSTTAETQEQPPTIHVTIGRIEVKASPPVAVPKRRASASPTMSLDEYLRRRSGGER